MGHRGLFARLYSYCLLISLVCLLLAVALATLTFQNFAHERSQVHLNSLLALAAHQFDSLGESPTPDQLNAFVRDFTASTGESLQLLNGQGMLWNDSARTDLSGESDVIQALQGATGESMSRNRETQQNELYVSRPILKGERVEWILRSKRVLVGWWSILAQSFGAMLISIAILFVVLALLSWRIVKRVSRPLDRLRIQAEKISVGDFSARVEYDPADFLEVENLGRAMNEMAQVIGQKIKTMTLQNNQQDSVFASMSEGVLAVDLKERILHLNQAAGKIFDAAPEKAVGRSVQEVVRVAEIQEFIQDSLRRDHSMEREIELKGQGDKTLQLRASPLRDHRLRHLGTVLVINDITKLKKLETHRRDFVANVSHELRTPLTSIQGFAETLLSPQVKDPEEVKKFLEIIRRHAARLGTIVEDLLTLSRIEREEEHGSIELKEEPLEPVILSAIELCDVKAQARQVKINYDGAARIDANINSTLLEQALVNLIDNAVKHSESGQAVDIVLSMTPAEIVISVIDQGPGIAPQHLPRLFERFYRVDKARSRQQGGTGLGLAIAKHVAIAHNGRLEVASEIGRGSQFSLILPRA